MTPQKLEALIETTRLRLLDASATGHLPHQPDQFAAMARALVMQCPEDIREQAVRQRPPRTHDAAWLRQKRSKRIVAAVETLMKGKGGMAVLLHAAVDAEIIDKQAAAKLKADIKRKVN